MEYYKVVKFVELAAVGLIIADELGPFGAMFYSIFLVILMPEKELDK